MLVPHVPVQHANQVLLARRPSSCDFKADYPITLDSVHCARCGTPVSLAGGLRCWMRSVVQWGGA